MAFERINVKFFVANPNGTGLEVFIAVFHSWVQASDGEYYDIADYSHVDAGPGVLLVAHTANISMDNTENRLGLLYNQKTPVQGSNGEKLRSVFRSALEYCRRIEEEPALGRKIKFLGSEALLILNDRLLAPNTEETFQIVKPDLEELARSMYAGAEFELTRDPDPRKRFNVKITTPTPVNAGTLLKNLSEGVEW